MVKKVTLTPRMSEERISNAVSISSAVIVPPRKKRKQTGEVGLSGTLEGIMRDTANGVSDNKKLMRLLPDLELLAKIMVGSILAPKDMMGPSLAYSLKLDPTRKHPDPGILGTIENHFSTDSGYNLLSKLSKILHEALFEYGAYAVVTLPEKTLEDMAKAARVSQRVELEVRTGIRPTTGKKTNEVGFSYGMESYMSNINNTVEALENYGIIRGGTLNNLTFTDNPSIMRASETTKDTRTELYSRRVGMEGYVYPKLSTNSDNDKPSRNPMVMKIPIDSLIPVYTSTDPENPLGHYILLGNNGHPVSNIQSEVTNARLKRKLAEAAKGNSLGDLIKATGLSASGDTGSSISVKDMAVMYDEMIDKELTTQLTDNGVFGDDVIVSRPAAVYKTMFYRAMMETKTKVLFLPSPVVTYYAFRYNEYGVGESLLEATKHYGGMRAVLLYSQVMSGVKSSIGRSVLDVTIDEDDVDPEMTVSAAISAYSSYQSDLVPFNLMNFDDIGKALNRAGVDVNVDGGENYPTTKTEIREAGRDYVQPDTDTLEALKAMQYLGIGPKPEMVEAVMSGESATSVISRDTLFAKIVLDLSSEFDNLNTRFIQNYIYGSQPLLEAIENSLTGELTVREFVEGLRVELPKPDITKIKAQSEAYETFADFVDIAVEAYVTEDMVDSMIDGDLDTRVFSALRASVAAVAKREWMSKQNILPELAGLFTADGDKNVSSNIADHNKVMMGILTPIIKKLTKGELKLSKALDKVRNPEEVEDEDTPQETPEDKSGDDEDTPQETPEDKSGDVGGYDDMPDME